MQFTYKPEGIEPKVWEFEPNKLMSVDTEAIEKHTKMTFGRWKEAVAEESALAIRALLFVCLRRGTGNGDAQPGLKWEHVQFCMDEVSMDPSDEELLIWRDALLEKKVRTEEEEEALGALIEAIAERGSPEVEPIEDVKERADGDGPKESAPTPSDA